MKYIKEISLDLEYKNNEYIKVKQNDTGRYLLFRILIDGLKFNLYDYELKFYCIKSDGNYIFNDLTVINSDEGLAELNLTEQITSTSGIMKGEISIYGNGAVISSMPILFEVISSTRNSVVESTSEFKSLLDAITTVSDSKKLSETALNIAKNPLPNIIASGYKIKPNDLDSTTLALINNNLNLSLGQGLQVNKGQEYPLKRVIKDGAISDSIVNAIKNAILDIKIFNADLNRIYALEWIGNGYSQFDENSKYGFTICSYPKDTYATNSTLGKITVLARGDYDLGNPNNSLVTKRIKSKTGKEHFVITLNYSEFIYDYYNLTTTSIIIDENCYSSSSYDEFEESKYKMDNLAFELPMSRLPFVKTISKNLFNKETVLKGYYIGTTTGNLFANENYCCTDYIKLEVGKSYTIRFADGMALYDKNFKFVKGIDKTTEGFVGGSPFTFTVDENICYVRCTVLLSRLDVQTFVEGTVALNQNNANYKTRISELTIDTANIEGKYPIEEIDEIVFGKNIFDKNKALKGYYIGGGSGLLTPNETYYASDYIKVEENETYTISHMNQIYYYDEDKNGVSGILSSTGQPTQIVIPSGCKYLRTSIPRAFLEAYQIEKGNTNTSYEPYGYTFKNLITTSKHKRLYTLHQAWLEWQKNEKFPVGFLADSTCDGNGTTGWVKHIDSDTLAGGIGLFDHRPPNAYCTVLENLIKKELKVTNPRIYNMGYSGTSSPYLTQNIKAITSGVYSDVKMVGLGHGINDRLYAPTLKDLDIRVRTNFVYAIEYLYSVGIQPFLFTSQYTAEAGTNSSDVEQYPNRTNETIESICNKVKRELAQEYDLELIDLSSFGNVLLNYSDYKLIDLIADKLHFSDLGHFHEGGFLFSEFCPRVITIDKKEENIISLFNQKIQSKLFNEKSTYLDTKVNGFKMSVDYVKNDSLDIVMMDFYILNTSKEKLDITFYAPSLTKQYVTINDVTYNISNTIQKLDTLDVGLYHIVLKSGATNKVSAYGFKIS